MNANLEVFLSALTSFAIVAGGVLTTVLVSQPAGTASINKLVWVGAVISGLVAAAKDVRSTLKLPPTVAATMIKAGTVAKVTVVLMAAFLLVGCSTVKPYLTPAALTTEVAEGVQLGLDSYPAAAPDVALARDAICSVASTTNVSPTAIVNDIAALGITNNVSKVLINAGVQVFEDTYALLPATDVATVQPYVAALCTGFTQGLPPSTAAAKNKRKLLPPHLK